MSLSELSKATPVFRCSYSMGSPVRDQVRTGILMTRSSSSVKAGVWTVSGKTFEGSAGDILVIKAGEIHSFKALVIHHWYNSTFTSVPASSKRTYKAVDCNAAAPAVLGKMQALLVS